MREVTPAGHSPAVWAAEFDRAPIVRVADLIPGAVRMLVLAAHPDDETIGAGRLISAWARARGPVDLGAMTDGEACLQHLDIQIPGLAATRRAELTAAVRELGARVSWCAGLPDGGLAAALADPVDVLDTAIRSADVVLAPWRIDPHPDHAALGAAAATYCERRGVPLLEYAIWSTYWQSPEVLGQNGYRLVRVGTDPADNQARRRALDRYCSQLRPLGADLGPVVPAPMLAHHHEQFLFRPVEGRL